MTGQLVDEAAFDALKDTTGADFVQELVGAFADEAPTILHEMRAAAGAGVAERFRRAAHSLKTNAQTFGAVPLAEAARQLELAGLPPDVAPLDALDALYHSTVAVLEELTRA